MRAKLIVLGTDLPVDRAPFVSGRHGASLRLARWEQPLHPTLRAESQLIESAVQHLARGRIASIVASSDHVHAQITIEGQAEGSHITSGITVDVDKARLSHGLGHSLNERYCI